VTTRQEATRKAEVGPKKTEMAAQDRTTSVRTLELQTVQTREGQCAQFCKQCGSKDSFAGGSCQLCGYTGKEQENSKDVYVSALKEDLGRLSQRAEKEANERVKLAVEVAALKEMLSARDAEVVKLQGEIRSLTAALAAKETEVVELKQLQETAVFQQALKAMKPSPTVEEPKKMTAQRSSPPAIELTTSPQVARSIFPGPGLITSPQPGTAANTAAGALSPSNVPRYGHYTNSYHLKPYPFFAQSDTTLIVLRHNSDCTPGSDSPQRPPDL
jgi:hypothetical protein